MELLDLEQERVILRNFPKTGPAWIAQLASVAARCVERWHLSIKTTIRPGGGASWAATVSMADGTDAVLKVGLPNPEPVDLEAALQSYNADGIVRLLACEPRDNAFLFELCEPGTTAESLSTEQRDAVAASVLPRLWADPPATPMPSLSQLAARRGQVLRDRGARHQVDMYSEGAEIFDALVTSSSPSQMLHGDFHPPNVILSARGWLAIDPRPMVGEPAFDVAIHLINEVHSDPRVADRADALAEAVGVDPARARLWLTAQAAHLSSLFRDTGRYERLEGCERAARRLLASL